MGRLVMAVITIGILGYIGYRTMYGRSPATPEGTSAPKERLQNVQRAADRIEAEQQKAAEEALKKSQGD